MNIIKYTVEHRLASIAIVFAFIVLGFYSFARMPVDYLPSITYPMIKVHIWWRGATPEEIEKNIAEPIERQMATVDDLDFLESSSIEGMYTLLVNFQYGVDVNVAYQDVLAAMARVARELPTDMDAPVVIKADPSQLPIVQMTVASEKWDLIKIRTWVDEWLQDQLLAVSGVAGAEIVGGLKREIRVLLDPEGLEKYGLSLVDIKNRLQQENKEQFGGRLTVGPREIIARTMGEYSSLEEIGAIALVREGLSTVYLRDIAKVVDSHEDARVITRLNGEPCVKLSVLKQSSANTVEVARAVEQRIDSLLPVLPDGIKLGMVENQATYVTAALNGVRNTAVQATILVILTVLLFLGSWRQTLVIALTLPLTMIFNFGLMKLAGFSFNIFSLGGLVIAIGVLVDNTVVVIENITRMRQKEGGPTDNKLVVKATGEVGPAIVAATLSFLALFLPFLLVPGLVSLLFRELILVIAGIIVISLIMAVTITPMLVAMISSKQVKEGKLTLFERFFQKITLGYGLILSFFIKYRWIVLSVFVLLLVSVVFLFGKLGSEFLPQMDDGRIMVKVRMPTGASVEETDKVLSDIEGLIGEDSRVESLYTLSGGRVWGLYTYEIANEGEINIQLVPRSQRSVTTAQFIDELRPIVSKRQIPGGNAMVVQMKVKGIRKLGDADIELRIKGQDTTQLFSFASKAAGVMREMENFTNVRLSMDMTKPEYQLILDRERMADIGVSATDIADTMHTYITGSVASRFSDKENYYNIRLMVPEYKIVNIDDLKTLPVLTNQGGYVRLNDVAEVVSAVGPVEIVRDDQVKQIVVLGDVKDSSIGEVLNELKLALDNQEIPEGVEVLFGGQAQMMAQMQKTVLMILVFAIFFSFIVLAVQFNSLKLPSLILGSVPFCIPGIVFLMLIAGQSLGSTVIIGVLVVIAVTINDGVLLLTFANTLRVGQKVSTAVVEAAKIRLRPRIMTTASTMIGFLPLAMGIEEGSDMLQPMAVAAIGGLLMEILVALFLMPCLYVIFSKKTHEKS